MFATFIGRTNVVKAELKEVDGKNHACVSREVRFIDVPTLKEEEKRERKVVCSIRPEEFILEPDATEGLKATVDQYIFLGLKHSLFCSF